MGGLPQRALDGDFPISELAVVKDLRLEAINGVLAGVEQIEIGAGDLAEVGIGELDLALAVLGLFVERQPNVGGWTVAMRQPAGESWRRFILLTISMRKRSWPSSTAGTAETVCISPEALGRRTSKRESIMTVFAPFFSRIWPWSVFQLLP